jgi:hypothetical protein
MTRSAVIIGIGGTGQWVLTYLKKDLMDLHGGQMPENVRLLAFDTVKEAEAERQVVGQAYSGEQAAYEKGSKRIGSISLDPDRELIHIGGDCFNLAADIEAGRYPHLNWFDVKYWKYEANLGRDNWILDRGAGRFRQFGLLAVHNDLLGGPVRSEILKKLPSAINEVQEKAKDDSFEIIVVGSVAGGTGSAMLIPFGVLARKLNSRARTRAVVVLPSAFSPGRPNAELELRGGAALRELSRAMMVPSGYKATMTFLPGHREYNKVEYETPFEGIYFIDGVQNGRPINNDPRFGAFPAAATWIRQILDEKSGSWFTRYITTNVKGAMAGDSKRQAEGVFGVFGVKSLFTPERTLRQTYQLKLADQVLRKIVDVRDGPGGRLISNPQPTDMPEPPSKSYDYLMNPARFDDQEQLPTSLMSEIARIVRSGGRNNGEEVNRKAEAGWAGRTRQQREQDSWLTVLTSLPSKARYDALRSDVASELQADFYKRFVPSDQNKPPRDPGGSVVYTEFTSGIDDFVRDHHGGMGSDGPEDYGSFGDMAQECAKAQVAEFQEALRLHLSQLLNEKPGRLGYSIRVVQSLAKVLKDFIAFTDEVEQTRNKRSPRVEIETEISNRRKIWERERKTPPGLLEKLQKKQADKALKAERIYLQVHANRVDYVREETLHNAVKMAARSMQVVCDSTLKELERWENLLLEGDRARDITGLLADFQSELDRVQTTIQADSRSSAVEELVQVKKRESDINEADISWALAGIQWGFKATEQGLIGAFELHPDGVNKGELRVVRDGMETAERRFVEFQNKATLSTVLGQRFGQVEAVTDVLQWCQNEYPDAKDLADLLADASEPLTDSPRAQPVMEAFSVSVNREKDPLGYAVQLETELRVKLTGAQAPRTDHPVEVIGSEDPYRLTAVRTQVGLMLEEFTVWDTCTTAYETELDKAQDRNIDLQKLKNRLKSNYTQLAEKRAIDFEVKWRTEGLEHRVLNPRMVALLGKERDLQIAIKCWLLGWVVPVRDKETGDYFHWQLNCPDWDYEFWLTPNRTRQDLEDDFGALESFVLLSQNHARGRRGAQMDLVTLNTALARQYETIDNELSCIHQAINVALEDKENGLIAKWETMAERYIDPETGVYAYRNPVYRDLADYVRDYSKELLAGLNS